MVVRAGWPHSGMSSGWNGPFRLTVLQGILLAHVFFNLPMASRLLLQSLENIPGEQRQLAAQLGMRGWHFFRFVEWPWLRRQILPMPSTHLYAVLRQLRHRSVAGRRATGHDHRAGYLSGAEF